MTRRLLAALLVTAAAATPATAAGTPRGPKLAGTTTVSATRPAVTRLYLPAETTIEANAAGSPNVTLTGDGRVTGLVLAPAGSGRAAVVVVSVGDCHAAGCRAARRTSVVTFPDSVVTPVLSGADRVLLRLKPGSYDVYVLTDGAPVTARLTLPNLRGAHTAVARDPAGLTVVDASPSVRLPAYTVTHAHDVRAATGLLTSAVVLTGPANGGGTASVCWSGAGGTRCVDAAIEASPDVTRAFAWAAGHVGSRGAWSQRVDYANVGAGDATVVQLWLDLAGAARR